jgi:DNA-binding NarL/FixJ family response regulator
MVDGDMGAVEAVREMLGSSADFQCRGSYGTAGEGLEAVPKLGVWIVLVGAVLPDCCGIQCVRALRARQPWLGIIIASHAPLDEVMARHAVAAGANACLVKPLLAVQCLATLRLLAVRVHSTHGRFGLNERDEQFMWCLAEGLMYKEIADRLGVSASVVVKLRKRIFKEIRAPSRVIAVNEWLDGE